MAEVRPAAGDACRAGGRTPRIASARRGGTGAPPIGAPVPDVAAMLAIGLELVAPGQRCLLHSSASRELPLRLGREPASRPRAVGHGVVVRHLDDGMVLAPGDRRSRSLGMTPVGAADLAPPTGARQTVLNCRAPEIARQATLEDEGPAQPLAVGLVVRSVDEGSEVGVGDGAGVDAKRVDEDLAHRGLAVARYGFGRVGAHEEAAAVETYHVPSVHLRTGERTGSHAARNRAAWVAVVRSRGRRRSGWVCAAGRPIGITRGSAAGRHVDGLRFNLAHRHEFDPRDGTQTGALQ